MNVGVVSVPDERLDRLAELYHPVKFTPAVLEFVDIAGLVKGASKGEGLGNKFLADIREVDAVGFNCSLGPAEILSLAEELRQWTDLPLVGCIFFQSLQRSPAQARSR